MVVPKVVLGTTILWFSYKLTGVSRKGKLSKKLFNPTSLCGNEPGRQGQPHHQHHTQNCMCS